MAAPSGDVGAVRMISLALRVAAHNQVAEGRGVTPRWHDYRYGEHPAQVAGLALPAADPRGTVVLLHGGFWRARYDRTLQHAVAEDLRTAGWAVWNVDYRAVPPGPNDGGGWPATQQDVATAVDLLATVAPAHGLGMDDVVVAGHS